MYDADVARGRNTNGKRGAPASRDIPRRTRNSISRKKKQSERLGTRLDLLPVIDFTGLLQVAASLLTSLSSRKSLTWCNLIFTDLVKVVEATEGCR